MSDVFNDKAADGGDEVRPASASMYVRFLSIQTTETDQLWRSAEGEGWLQIVALKF